MRPSKKYEFKGQSKTVIEWSEETGIPKYSLWYRLRQGWSIEKAISSEGINHRSNWKGGKIIDSNGYILMYVSESDPLFSMTHGKGSYALEHRIKIARHLGRLLLESETVHHINGDRSDNCLSNLQLRIGRHGKGQAYCCAECGSSNLRPIEL
jgi:hypothetical protein